MQIAAMSMVSVADTRAILIRRSLSPELCPARDPSVISFCLSSPVTDTAVLHPSVALVDHKRRATSGSSTSACRAICCVCPRLAAAVESYQLPHTTVAFLNSLLQPLSSMAM